MVITIDGPAASGKSSLSRELARRLGWNWLSTGAFYRGLAYTAIQQKIDFKDVAALVKLCANPVWRVETRPHNTLVFYNNTDVTSEILKEEVGNYASQISKHSEVRKTLLENQRRFSEGPDGLVAEGRDCGTVVFPQAVAKIYLTANSENRAARRAAEHGASHEEIIQAQKLRDEQDSKRKVAPLQVPENAYVLDTTHMTLDEVIEKVEFHVKTHLKIL